MALPRHGEVSAVPRRMLGQRLSHTHTHTIQIQRSIPRLSAQHLRYGGLVAMGGRGWRGAPA
eukprot:COSAG03_NODE_6576_length_1038_cov_1.530351_1_plen_61_part_10